MEIDCASASLTAFLLLISVRCYSAYSGSRRLRVVVGRAMTVSRVSGGDGMLDAFYGAFSPACLSLLGLWLVVVQLRLPQWQASEAASAYQRASYGVALHFALPGLMSVLALIDTGDPAYWQTSFGIIALGGAIALIVLGGLFGRGGRGDGHGGHDRQSARGADPRLGGSLGLAAYIAAIAAYLVVGVLAFVGGPTVLRVEAILLTSLVFLGFNVAWLLLFDKGGDSRATAPARPAAPTAVEPDVASADIDITPTASGWAPDSPTE